MFENVVLHKKSGIDDRIDAGILAEALLFYQNVTVLLNFGNAGQFIKAIGVDLFFELIVNHNLKVTFSISSLATQTGTANDIQHHSPVLMQWVAPKGAKSKAKNVVRNNIEKVLTVAGVPRFQMTEYIYKFQKLIDVTDIPHEILHDDGASIVAQGYIDSPALLNDAAEIIIGTLAPQYPLDKPLNLQLVGPRNQFYIMHDIDFDQLIRMSREHTRIDDYNLTPALLVQHVFAAQLDLLIGARYGFSISTGDMPRRINELRLQNLYEKITKESGSTNLFMERTIGNVGSIREAINSEEKSFAEYMPLLEESDKFKKWLKTLNDGDELIDEYYEEVSRQGWADKLPGKSIRFSLFTGAGLFADLLTTGGLATAASLGLGVIDTFLVDKLILGWKPSSFVEDAQNFLQDN